MSVSNEVAQSLVIAEQKAPRFSGPALANHKLANWSPLLSNGLRRGLHRTRDEIFSARRELTSGRARRMERRHGDRTLTRLAALLNAKV